MAEFFVEDSAQEKKDQISQLHRDIENLKIDLLYATEEERRGSIQYTIDLFRAKLKELT
jgi:hypothetical protein